MGLEAWSKRLGKAHTYADSVAGQSAALKQRAREARAKLDELQPDEPEKPFKHAWNKTEADFEAEDLAKAGGEEKAAEDAVKLAEMVADLLEQTDDEKSTE